MQRAIVLAGLVILGTLSPVAARYQQSVYDRAKRHQQPQGVKIPTIEKIATNLYVIGGSTWEDAYDLKDSKVMTGGNTAVWITEGGVVLVDTKSSGWGRMILDKVKSVTTKPVTTIINTHSHADHTGSNIEFAATVHFVAHENTRAQMARPDCPDVHDGYTNCNDFTGENAKFLPKTTFRDQLSLFAGKDRVDLYYFGPGHTTGDAFVVFPAARAMHAGDMFAFKDALVVARENGGSAKAFLETTAKALNSIKSVDIVIPGHAPIMQWKDYEEYLPWQQRFVAEVEEAWKAGIDVETEAAAFSEKYKGVYQLPSDSYTKRFVRELYAELDAGAK